MNARGEPDDTMEATDAGWLAAEEAAATVEIGGSASPCRLLKFSFCSSNFLLISA